MAEGNERQDLARSAKVVQDFLNSKGVGFSVRELSSSTRTADDAAQTLGCDVAQIVKSLVFKTKNTHKPILVLASGINRVNEKVIASHVGEKITKADAAFTRQVTGFAIGGIPPVAHAQPLETYIDEDLLQHAELWAAAGTPNTVFCLSAKELQELTGGTVITIQ